MATNMKFTLPIIILSWLLGGIALASELEDVYPSTPSSTTYPKFNPDNIEKFADEITKGAQQKWHIPGVTISIVKDGKLLFSKGYGQADKKNKILVNSTLTQFPVGSISKAFTFTALMQLVQNGDITLDDHVSDLLDFEEIDRQYTPITIRQLFSHSTGFEESFLGSSAADGESNDTPLMEFIQKFREERVKQNGKYIVYSNYAVTLAGAVIEKIKGVPFEVYMHEYILSPLKMNESAFYSSNIPMTGEHGRAVGHQWTGNGFIDNREHYLRQGNYPAGGLLTTADDMAKFMLFHLSNGSTEHSGVLAPEMIKRMHSVLKKNHPELPGITHGIWSNNIRGYKSLEHDGMLDGVASRMLMIPELNLGIFISTNSSNGYRLTQQFDRLLLAKFFPNKQPESSVKQNIDLTKYAGSYLMMWGNSSSIEHLTAAPTYVSAQTNYLTAWIGFSEGHWYPLGNDVFENKQTGEKIAFKIDENENLLLLTHDMVFEKISFFENSKNFLYSCVIGFILSVLLLVKSLVTLFIKSNYTSEEKRFLNSINLLAALWVAFIASLAFTIVSSASNLAPEIYVHFPDKATIIGQWVLTASILCVGYLIANLKSYWCGISGKKISRTINTLYIGLIIFLLAWSVEFNLIGFQY